MLSGRAGATVVGLALMLVAGCGVGSMEDEAPPGPDTGADGAPPDGAAQPDAAVELDAASVLGTPCPEAPRILSAFVGVYDVPGVLFPVPARCALGVVRLDGMPIVLTHEVDRTTLDEADIEVELSDGTVVNPSCADPAPADEENEDRTLLLVGEFGTEANPPVVVRIVGDLLTEADGPGGAQSLRGQSMDDVTPLAVGPSLAWAERLPPDEVESGMPGDCPAETVQVVQLTWQGGVTAPSGDELGAGSLAAHAVRLRGPDGAERWVEPVAFGDLDDGDNNVDLCLDVPGVPLEVRVEAATVSDPGPSRDGADLNPETSVIVYDGWAR